MHRDHVPALPPAFHLLGATAVSPVQGMVRFAPSSASSPPPPPPAPSSTSSTSTPHTNEGSTPDADLLRGIQILTVQGHPEFTESVVSAIVEQRAASGAIDAPTAHDYNVRRRWDADDGRGRIARAVWGVVLGGVGAAAAAA
ncbi:hypothetical protein BJ912DRAFT_925249 [Pholiota molesta]|nr:hypothetical protein BJ912DRAFT_925249 [Pholiota molesta]